jgi:hypothetical protein
MKHYFPLARIFYCIGIVGIAFLLAGLACLPAYAATTQNSAYVRIIHASPFIGTADVFVDGKQLLSSFQFAAVTGYVPVPAGVHKVQIAIVGKGINASVLTQDLTVNAGYAYTVAALGTAPNNLSLQVFVDNNLVVPNRAKVRIYCLSPNAGAVTAAMGEIKLSNPPYPYASNYVNMSTGSYMFSFNDPQHNVTLSMPVTLNPNTVASVFALGLFGGNPKAQIVTAVVPGIPGLPGTGSDPTLVDTVMTQPFLTWLLVAVLLVLVGIGPAIRYLKRT